MTVRALVVGGTSGIGLGIAQCIANRANAFVTICGRTQPADLPSNIEFRQLEATSMRQIKVQTDVIKSGQQELDLLVMSQGIMNMQGRTETPEGIDRKMALHYYGKQLLIRELLPVLKENAKVIIVYDGWLGDPSKLDWDDLDLKKGFSLSRAANHCMTMNDCMVQYFAAEQQRKSGARRHFIHAWPGGVNTRLYRELPWYLQPLMRGLGPILTVSPKTYSEKLLHGVDTCSASGEKNDRFWSNIDNKGNLIKNKMIWTQEQMNTIADHTWSLIDKALTVAP